MTIAFAGRSLTSKRNIPVELATLSPLLETDGYPRTPSGKAQKRLVRSSIAVGSL